MPRPEQVQAKAAEDAPHGETAHLQEMVSAAPIVRQQPPPQPQPERGGGEPPLFASPSPEPLQLQGDTTGFDAQLFGPSNRPGEELTHGAPFGPGANFIPQPAEDQRSFLMRVATSLQGSPGATPEVLGFVARILRGE